MLTMIMLKCCLQVCDDKARYKKKVKLFKLSLRRNLISPESIQYLLKHFSINVIVVVEGKVMGSSSHNQSR